MITSDRRVTDDRRINYARPMRSVVEALWITIKNVNYSVQELTRTLIMIISHYYLIQQNVDYPNVNHPKRQISEHTFSSFYVQTMKNQPLLHAIKYCVIPIKYCILYILYCIVMITLSQRNIQILCTVWLLGSVIRTIAGPN